MQTKFSKRIVHCPYEEEPVKTPCQRSLMSSEIVMFSKAQERLWKTRLR